VYARLDIAQQNLGKLVVLIRQQARQVAEEEGASYIISDGPLGIDCLVISSLWSRPVTIGKRAHFLWTLCVNKYNIKEGITRQIETYCSSQSIEVTAKILFNNSVTRVWCRDSRL
jgi:MinD superfamily P-loop ATPase